MPILEDDVLWAKNLQNDPTTGRPNREPIPLEQLHSGILRNQGIARPFYNQILYQQGQATLTLQSEYIAADGVLQDNLDAEILARSTADTALQGNLDIEAATRASADTLLQDNIDTEANTRLTTDNSLQGQIDSLLTALNDLTDKVIPKVGDTWITKSTETPSDRFGVGTWSLIEGKMLIGVDGADTDFDTIGEEGGSKDHVHTANSNTITNTIVDEHTLTVAQIPAHKHSLPEGGANFAVYGTTTDTNTTVENFNADTTTTTRSLTSEIGGSEGHTHTAASSSTTTTTLDTVSNMNPYHVVYIWERTA